MWSAVIQQQGECINGDLYGGSRHQAHFQQGCSHFYPFKGGSVSRRICPGPNRAWAAALRGFQRAGGPTGQRRRFQAAARWNNPPSMWAHCDNGHKSPFYNLSQSPSLSLCHVLICDGERRARSRRTPAEWHEISRMERENNADWGSRCAETEAAAAPCGD